MQICCGMLKGTALVRGCWSGLKRQTALAASLVAEIGHVYILADDARQPRQD